MYESGNAYGAVAFAAAFGANVVYTKVLASLRAAEYDNRPSRKS